MADTNNTEQKLGGNITLVDFKLEPIELVVVKKIAGNYARKLSEKTGYKELKLRLRQHEHGKTFLHEINAEAIISKDRVSGSDLILTAASENYNIFSALADVMEKILRESESKIKA